MKNERVVDGNEIKIRRARQEDQPLIKALVFEGLCEIIKPMVKRTVLPHRPFQVLVCCVFCYWR